MSAGAVARFRARDVIHSGSPHLACLPRPRLRAIPVKILAGLAIALLLASTTVVAHAADTSGAGRYSETAMFARLHSLPPVLQKAMVAVVWADAVKNDNDIEMNTPDKLLDAFKIRAIEADRMSRVAKAADWAEAGDLLKQLSDTTVHMIRGDVGRADSETALQKIDMHYRQMLTRFQSENAAALRAKPDEAVSSLRKDLLTYIAAPARIYVWGSKSKGTRNAGND